MIKEKYIYHCMCCKSQYQVMPEHRVCTVCGMPINNEKVRYVQHDSKECFVLIKISDQNALKSMRNGELWFQSPKYYQSFAENDVVGDVNECAYDYILDVPLCELKEYSAYTEGDDIVYKGNKYLFKKIANGMVYVISAYQNNYRLFCMYSLKFDSNHIIKRPDVRIKEFGDYFSVIRERERLIHIIGDKVEGAKYDVTFLPTEIAYISDKYRGVYTPGCKFGKYRYQNEYRFILSSPNYGRLPEKKEKKVILPEIPREKILSHPLPINLLWEINSLEELIGYVENT